MNRFLKVHYNIGTTPIETGFDKDEFKNLLEIGNLSEDEITVAFLFSPSEVLALDGISIPKNAMLHFLSKTILGNDCIKIFKRDDVNAFLEEALHVYFANYRKNYVRDAYTKHDNISDDASHSLCKTVKKLIELGIELPDSIIQLLMNHWLLLEDRDKFEIYLSEHQ